MNKSFDPDLKNWLREHHQTRLGRVLADIILIYTIIALSIVAAIESDSWIVYLLSILIIGSRQHALGALVHEGTHYTLCKNRVLNDLICDLFCAFPIFISTRGFRIFHLQHHRYTRTERDPEVMAINQDPEFRWPKTKFQTYSLLTRDILGINIHSILSILFIWSDALSLLRLPKSLWMKLKFNEDMAGFLDRTSPKFKLSLGLKLRLVLFYGTLFMALSYLNLWKYYFLYWLVPMFTVLAFIIRVRGMSEHNGLAFESDYNSSRTTLEESHLIELFIAPLGVNYHLEHHLYPQVPYFHLKALHQQLKKTPGYLTAGGISPGYLDNIQRLTVTSLATVRPQAQIKNT